MKKVLVHAIGALAWVLLVLLCCTPPAEAQYHDGYVSPGGYTYRGGYWYYGSQAYTRSLLYYPGTSYCSSYSYYHYTPYYPPSYPAAAPSVDFDTALLKIKAEQQDTLNKIAKLKAAGLTVEQFQQYYPGVLPMPYQQQGYPPYGLQGHYYNYVVPVNANSQFGYATYKEQVQNYPVADVNLAVQMYGQAGQEVLRLGKIFMGDLREIINVQGEQAAAAADRDAKMRFALAVLQTLNSAQAAKYQGFKFEITPGGVKTMNSGADPAARAAARAEWEADAKQNCVSCHSGPTAKGKFAGRGFDILKDYPTLSQEEKQIVWQRITIQPGDPGYEVNMMPRAQGGGPGTPLPKTSVMKWLAY